MRKRLSLVLAGLVALVMVGGAVATASPSETYSDSYFGDGNLPPGCIRNMSPDNPENTCFHMRVGLNALDSPQVDVLVLVPASPTAERDMRIMRQAIEMWEGGIEYLAGEMDMAWLQQVDFHVTVDALDGELTTYPIVDPEIVVIATNPVGGVGIGIDPVSFASELEIIGADSVPCTTIENPFDMEAWEAVPGFDSHHEKRSGTYVEDCGGAGGNVCFAVNGAIDPVPGTTEIFSIFDLVTHEVGHCLTIGHVGDGAEGSWGAVPTNDIMSYSEDPPGLAKCVSTLDVEGFALRMSRYVDRNGDGKVTKADHLEANDVPGDGRNSFQVQSPADHLYASGTGSPQDCPQPDVGLVPGERVDWEPSPVRSATPVLDVERTTPRRGTLRVAGTVTYRQRGKQPTSSTASFVDRSGDSTSPFNDVEKLSVKVTDTTVKADVQVAQLWPTTQVTSVGAYSVIINGRRFDSFVAPGASTVSTWDNAREVYLPGASSWDQATGTVQFRIPRRYLERFRITAPYWVGSQASVQNGKRLAFVDDTAPEGQARIGVTGRPLPPVTRQDRAFDPPTGTKPYTVRFRAEGGNRFSAGSSNAGESLVADNHLYSFDVRSPSNVTITLGWDDEATDLDLRATTAGGRAAPGGATSDNPETITMKNVRGLVDLEVVPFLVGPAGTTYTLKAVVDPIGKDSDRDGLTDPGDQCRTVAGPAPSGCPDRDRDGVANSEDRCVGAAGPAPTGCPAPATEWVRVFVDGKLRASERVDRVLGVGRFGLDVAVGRGRHVVRTVWADRSGVIAAVTRRVG